MTKEQFCMFVDEVNKWYREGNDPVLYTHMFDGKIYRLESIDSQSWHDDVVDTENGKADCETLHQMYQLVSSENGKEPWQECNFYALHMTDMDENGYAYPHDLMPMTKVTTYHPEVVIPPHEEEHYVYMS